MSILKFLLPLFCFFCLASSLTFVIPANSEECYYERLEVGAKLTVMFQVVHGGALDVDFAVWSPDNRLIYEAVKQSETRFAFEATSAGGHKICFNNKFSSFTNKVISFGIFLGEDSHKNLATKDHLGPVENGILQLADGLRAVYADQEYLIMRERVHRDTTDSTHEKVVYWNLFESFVLIAMSIWQIIYIRRFFEVKRVV
eukprot:TRINITY_DN3299_c0_g1_i1.p1 TRINITY_DN3299_c0_g1~~TRINITY_DN3299_c0_g1_i1.p1  ORF type:complete len:200 (-),score=74.46 TRINITY_DN3299_c0_g1_i1:300-899(-)